MMDRAQNPSNPECSLLGEKQQRTNMKAMTADIFYSSNGRVFSEVLAMQHTVFCEHTNN
jgi:hypothetical protein